MGYVNLDVSKPRLFEGVATAIISRDLESCNPQALSNIVWAYTISNEPCHPLYKKVADSVIARDLEAFKPQDISNIIWEEVSLWLDVGHTISDHLVSVLRKGCWIGMLLHCFLSLSLHVAMQGLPAMVQGHRILCKTCGMLIFISKLGQCN